MNKDSLARTRTAGISDKCKAEAFTLKLFRLLVRQLVA